MQTFSSVTSTVSLADVFSRDAILLPLAQRTKQGVIQELVHRLVQLGFLGEEHEKAVVQSILGRERLGSTAMGKGFAFPHCRTTAVSDRIVGALGLDAAGIAFDAVDGEPVHAVFLMLSPLDLREQHYELLGRVTALGKDKSLRLQLKGCRNVEAAHRFIRQFDE